MSNLNLCDYSGACILVKRTISVESAAGAPANNKNKEVIIKKCAPFTSWISETNSTQIDNTKAIDAVMPMYNLIKYIDNYLKKSGSLWGYYRDEPALDVNNTFFIFLLIITGLRLYLNIK